MKKRNPRHNPRRNPPTRNLANVTSSPPSPPAVELLTAPEAAEFLRCSVLSIYNLTRARASRYDHPLPVIRTPMGLRFRRSSLIQWLTEQETA